MASRFFAPAVTFGQVSSPPALIDPYRLLQQGLDSMLTDITRSVGQTEGGAAGDLLAGPRINVEENDNEIRLTAELPGVTDKDVQVTIDGDLLVITGEKKRDQALRLPFAPEPDKVQAGFKDGVLTIEVPKEAEQRTRTKQIPISREGDGKARTGEPGTHEGAQAAEQDQREHAQTSGH
jgi:HSP20 family protein